MRRTYSLFGWPVSPYTAKVRAYLLFKGIRFRDRIPSALELALRIRPKVGQIVMPTMRTPKGEWLQDSSEIIDHLERELPVPSIIPTGPTQRVLSYLLEVHGDEWLCVPALHYRWNRPENVDFCLGEFGRYALPGAPRRIQRWIGGKFAARFRAYPAVLGITSETARGVERFTETLLAQLDAHLKEHRFLLGDRPSIGDFAFFGPLWAHLYRDPASTKLFDGHRSVQAWLSRMSRPNGRPGDFLPSDAISATLEPIVDTILREQFRYLERLVAAINEHCAANPDITRLPRALGHADFVIGGHVGRRRTVTYAQWMAQRPIAAYDALSVEEQASVGAWFAARNAHGSFRLPIQNPLARSGYKTILARWPTRSVAR